MQHQQEVTYRQLSNSSPQFPVVYDTSSVRPKVQSGTFNLGQGSGTIVFPDLGVFVPFSSRFFAPPHVVITLVVCPPQIPITVSEVNLHLSNITQSGFLLSGSYELRVTGNPPMIWSAIVYWVAFGSSS
ncbi:hypothetical protein [Spartinivicinus poritis]|uniref:H-type lectin domain-containing protein n=1 Tax=Spartinivicinus poritis TaxID=2994640 RepID=A0ABT5UIK2_9GAMM|nr:hypothetical protein [Spartinivicinus sp. A2-2]MDE1465811.1 hypothetical protein [Spartinivicinus sp. A2-2]